MLLNAIENRQYRPEIDGLRAIAVIGVILFHLDSGILPGGFLGVDAFFVISGFLIGRNILSEIESKKFSYLKFWKKRFNRLYPNLLLMVSFTVLAGNFILINPERRELVLQAVSSLLAFSNLYLWKTTGGYWDASSENIALLHTWSLSLEEQFYFVLPFILVFLMHRYGVKKLFPILLVLALASFILCIIVTEFRRSAAFYTLPTRMWEFLLGVLLSSIPKNADLTYGKLTDGLLVLIGVFLIIISFFVIENNEGFPGFLPIFVCVGTVMIINFGKGNNLVSAFLRHPFIVYLGKISYSLYLWHWPVIVFSKYITTTPTTLGNIILTFILAIPAYHFVENKLRYNPKIAYRFCSVCALLFIAVLIKILSHSDSRNLPYQLVELECPSTLSRGIEFEATDSILNSNTGIFVGSKIDAPTIAVIGSSHARVLGAGLAEFVESNNLSAVMLATTMVGISSQNSKLIPMADIINDRRIQLIEKLRPPVVIVAGAWHGELKNPDAEKTIINLLTRIAKNAENVLVIGQVPYFDLPPGYQHSFRKYLVALSRSGQDFLLTPTSNYFNANSKMNEIVKNLRISNVEFLDISNVFLNGQGKIQFVDGSKILYYDDNHINDNGSLHLFKKYLNANLLEKIKNNLKKTD